MYFDGEKKMFSHSFIFVCLFQPTETLPEAVPSGNAVIQTRLAMTFSEPLGISDIIISIMMSMYFIMNKWKLPHPKSRKPHT